MGLYATGDCVAKNPACVRRGGAARMAVSMSLTCATLLFAAFLAALAAPFLWKGAALAPAYFKSLRSPLAAGVFFGGGGLWFLWHVLHLGKADWGDYRGILTVLFGVVIVGSFFWVRDFLAVRGLCLTYLLCASVLLDAAYAQAPAARVVFAGLVFAGIFISIYWGAMPFKARNFGEWAFGSDGRARAVGGVLAACAIACAGATLAY